MTTDYIVSSLPTLAFDAPAPLSWEKFVEACGGKAPAQKFVRERSLIRVK